MEQKTDTITPGSEYTYPLNEPFIAGRYTTIKTWVDDEIDKAFFKFHDNILIKLEDEEIVFSLRINVL